jgi:predicted DNA binding CopG/RHH family protein
LRIQFSRINFQVDLPDFKSREAELEYWDSVDTSDIGEPVDLKVKIDPALQKNMRPVTIRLRTTQIDALKAIADQNEVRYQTMVRTWIAERLRQELAKPSKGRKA